MPLVLKRYHPSILFTFCIYFLSFNTTNSFQVIRLSRQPTSKPSPSKCSLDFCIGCRCEQCCWCQCSYRTWFVKLLSILSSQKYTFFADIFGSVGIAVVQYKPESEKSDGMWIHWPAFLEFFFQLFYWSHDFFDCRRSRGILDKLYASQVFYCIEEIYDWFWWLLYRQPRWDSSTKHY